MIRGQDKESIQVLQLLVSMTVQNFKKLYTEFDNTLWSLELGGVQNNY